MITKMTWGIWGRILILESIALFGLGLLDQGFAGMFHVSFLIGANILLSFHLLLFVWISIKLVSSIPYNVNGRLFTLAVLLIFIYILSIVVVLTWIDNGNFFQVFTELCRGRRGPLSTGAVVIVILLAVGWSKDSMLQLEKENRDGNQEAGWH